MHSETVVHAYTFVCYGPNNLKHLQDNDFAKLVKLNMYLQGGGYALMCPWRYDVSAAAGSYRYAFWVGVTGTTSVAQYTPFTLSIRYGIGG